MIRIFGHYILKSIIYLALVEAVLLVVALRLGADLRLYVANIQAESATPGVGQYIVFVGAIQVTMLALGPYQRDTCRDIRQTLNTLFVVAVLSAGIIATIFFLVPGLALWRSMFVSGMIVALGFLFLTRVSFLRFVDRERIRKKVLVLGAGEFAQRIARLGDDHKQIGFTCEAFYRLPGETARLSDAEDLGDIDDIVSFCITHSIDEIVTAPDSSTTELPLQALLACKASGVSIVNYTRFLEREEGRVDVDALRPEWLVYGHNPARGTVQKALKRLLDVALSLVLLAITLPVMMIAYAAIRMTSRGPGFFMQERTGLNGQPFTTYFLPLQLDGHRLSDVSAYGTDCVT